MSQDPVFKMSQDYEIVPPQKKRAYPILVEEWEHLKSKIKAIQDNANLYHTVGSVLLGVCGSAFVTGVTLNIAPEVEGQIPIQKIVVWVVFVVSGLCGGLTLFFGREQRTIQKANSQEVIDHMELIERRYESGT